MAQAGFTPISLYFSSTAAAVPTSGNLANGELALNIADMKLYAKNSAGTVTLLASNAGASGSVTSVSGTGTVNGLTLTGTVTTSGSLTLGGTLSGVSLTSQVTGTLPTANGGTNLTSFTSGGLVYASSSSALATNSVLTFNGTSQLVLNPVSGTDTYILAGASGVAATYIGVNTSGATNGQGVVSGAGYLTVSGGYPWVVTTSGVERIRTTATGNTGFGTVSPTVRVHAYSTTTMAQLTVDGAGAIKTGINFASSGTTYGQIYFDNNAPYDMSVFQQYSTGSLRLGTNNTTRFEIGSAGQLGIGGATYGTAGQVLTSGGSGAAPTWATAASGAQAFVAFGSTGGY